jgi:hypothetical protein
MKTDTSKPPHRYADAPYEVGKGKPPQHTRFQKGQSGNSRGRKPKPKADEQLRAAMRHALEESMTVRTSAGEVRIPAIAAMFLRARNRILEKGNLHELAKFLALCAEYKVLKPEDIERSRGVLVVPQVSATEEEWERDYAAYDERRRAQAAALPQAATPSSPPATPPSPPVSTPKAAPRFTAVRVDLSKPR